MTRVKPYRKWDRSC